MSIVLWPRFAAYGNTTVPLASNNACVQLSTVVQDECVRHTGKQTVRRTFLAYSATQARGQAISCSAIVAPTDTKVSTDTIVQ
jgi:isoquinoline 1-oxidoreductase alpha subunit